jgi:hypothetical protein
VKLPPAVLPSGEIAYLRRDEAVKGVFYGMGTPGPKGEDLRTPSWSPDGKQVVYSRFAFARPIEPVKVWSRNSKYDLYATELARNRPHTQYQPAAGHPSRERNRHSTGNQEENMSDARQEMAASGRFAVPWQPLLTGQPRPEKYL